MRSRRQASDYDTRTTGGFADGDEFQAITTAEYFRNGTRPLGGCLKGPPRGQTTLVSIIYYVTLGEGARSSPLVPLARSTYRFPFHPCRGPSASLHIIHTTKFELYIRWNVATSTVAFPVRTRCRDAKYLTRYAARLRSNNRQRL